MTSRNHHDDDLHDRGLQFDVQTLMQRRHALKLFAGAAALVLVGCGDDDNTASTTSTSTSASPAATGESTTTAASPSAAGTIAAATATATATMVAAIPTTADTPASACTAEIPEETAGPYPGDGSNGPNALTASGIVRSDIRSSFGTSTTQAEGVPMTLKLTLVDTANDCKPLAGAALYAWHCDALGNYSMYSQGVTNENYLRGVQVADANGVVTFTSIIPGAYSGRWPHVHFEVYPSLDQATSSSNKLATSQLAIPEDVCETVYASGDYGNSLSNLRQTPIARDNVFSDGYALQMASATGDPANGYTVSLVVGV